MLKLRLMVLLTFILGMARATSAQQWTQLGPPQAYGQSAVMDTSTGQMITFGGTDGTNVFGSTWSNQTVATTNHNLSWTLVVVAGESPGRPEGYNRSGALVAANTMLAPPRAYAPAVWDAAHNAVHVQGGEITWSSKVYSDNHLFTLNLASQAWTHPAPESRMAHTAVYDSDLGQMWVFGGLHSITFGALTSLTKTTVQNPDEDWVNVYLKQSGSQGPPALFGHSAVMNSTTGVMTITLGATTPITLAPCQNAVWQLTGMHSSTPTWSQPSVSSGITARAFAASA